MRFGFHTMHITHFIEMSCYIDVLICVYNSVKSIQVNRFMYQ